MPITASPATVAEYFRLGLQVGLLTPEQAISWADAHLADSDTLPEEMIEVSWSKGLASTIDALAAIPGERNRQVAGRWLLGLLKSQLPDSPEGLHLATQRAMQIARQAELGEDAYCRFDLIDDELSLARTKVYGTIGDCRSNLLSELSEFEPMGVNNGA